MCAETVANWCKHCNTHTHTHTHTHNHTHLYTAHTHRHTLYFEQVPGANALVDVPYEAYKDKFGQCCTIHCPESRE